VTVELSPDVLKSLDPLALTNTVTISALVALLARKGLISEQELAEEVRRLRARVAELQAGPGRPQP
jgi:hypothetical protein